MPWFKAYPEFLNDWKMDRLSDAQFRIWWSILGIASDAKERGQISLDLEAIKFMFHNRWSLDEIAGALAAFEALGMIRIGPPLVVLNFATRQWGSPSNAPSQIRKRVARHRSNEPSNDGETMAKRGSNETEERRGEEEVEESTTAFSDFWVRYPRKIVKSLARKRFESMTKADQQQAIIAAKNYALSVVGREARHVLHPTSFLSPTGERWREFVDGMPEPPASEQVGGACEWVGIEGHCGANATELGKANGERLKLCGKHIVGRGIRRNHGL